MPVGPFPTFDSCVTNFRNKINPRTGAKHTKEEASRICGTIEKRTTTNKSKNDKKLSDRIFFVSSISFSEGNDLENKEFEILSAGRKVYQGEIIEITKADLNEMVANFENDIVGLQLAVDMNHDPDHKAFAWFASLRVEGKKLLATFKDFSDEGKQMILQKMFKYFSVEIDNGFEKIVGGVKQTFKNVLRGVAMTNRPVDKDIAPTFFAENDSYLLNLYNMKDFLTFAETLKGKAKITQAEKDLFNKMLSELSEEEVKSEEAIDASAEVEAKEVGEAEAGEDKEEKKEENKEEDKKEEEDEKEEENASLSERIKGIEQENSKLKAEFRFNETQKQVNAELLLSEDNPTGLNKDDAEKATKVLSQMSLDNAKEVINLLKSVKTVDFSEKGSDGAGATISGNNKKVMELAEALRKENPDLSIGQAAQQVLSENPTLEVE